MRANACEYRPSTAPDVWEPGCNSKPAFQALTVTPHFPLLHKGPIAQGWLTCPYCGGHIVEAGDLGAFKK